jgi:glutathione synthase/RimK-type ligase-like ATP-grasp enzyme
MTSTPPAFATPTETPFLGLASFLRMSIAGVDLQPVGVDLLTQAQAQPLDANLWMNLSTVTQCLGQHDLGLAMQAQALALTRHYHLAARHQPARLRLLMLLAAGDLAANTPLDCLLEDSDIDLDFYYVNLGEPLSTSLPAHDALLVCMGDSDANRELLLFLQHTLAAWPKPVINAAQHIPNTDRARASALLQNVPGLQMPPTLRVARDVLQAIATGHSTLSAAVPGCDFPLIVRPLDSQGGHDLAKICTAADLPDYLARVEDAEFFVSRFIDYSGQDGFFRKMRVALIDGVPYACHMAVSSHWMVHYVNAGMYDEAWKRAQELDFMTHFAAFALQHQTALQAIAQRLALDYMCIDCAQTPAGELLVFEVDHIMVVHAMDTQAQFPYKQTHMKKVKDAFRHYLLERCR